MVLHQLDSKVSLVVKFAEYGVACAADGSAQGACGGVVVIFDVYRHKGRRAGTLFKVGLYVLERSLHTTAVADVHGRLRGRLARRECSAVEHGKRGRGGAEGLQAV